MEEHWLNRAAEHLAPRTISSSGSAKIHCEILFPESDFDFHKGYSCSICFDGRVFMRRKEFSRDEWTFRILRTVPSDVFDRMRSFCKGCVGDYFNHLGFGMYGLSSGVIRINGSWTRRFHPMTRRWFCSEIVIEALKIGGYLPTDLSSVQHPETLYQLLQSQSSAGTAKNCSNFIV